jgi:hypothetical protein
MAEKYDYERSVSQPIMDQPEEQPLLKTSQKTPKFE